MNEKESKKNKQGLGSRLNEATKEHRVRLEAENLMGQVFAHTILRAAGKVLIDLVIVWCVLLLLHFALGSIQIGGECVEVCFVADSEECCPLSVGFIVRVVTFLLAVFAVSVLSTRQTEQRIFQHSAMLSTATIISMALVLLKLSIHGGVVVVMCVLAFFCFYGGYRVGLRR